jgi:hypothetical protein
LLHGIHYIVHGNAPDHAREIHRDHDT